MSLNVDKYNTPNESNMALYFMTNPHPNSQKVKSKNQSTKQN